MEKIKFYLSNYFSKKRIIIWVLLIIGYIIIAVIQDLRQKDNNFDNQYNYTKDDLKNMFKSDLSADYSNIWTKSDIGQILNKLTSLNEKQSKFVEMSDNYDKKINDIFVKLNSSKDRDDILGSINEILNDLNNYKVINHASKKTFGEWVTTFLSEIEKVNEKWIYDGVISAIWNKEKIDWINELYSSRDNYIQACYTYLSFILDSANQEIAEWDIDKWETKHDELFTNFKTSSDKYYEAYQMNEEMLQVFQKSHEEFLNNAR